jgi:hypothetical protein
MLVGSAVPVGAPLGRAVPVGAPFSGVYACARGVARAVSPGVSLARPCLVSANGGGSSLLLIAETPTGLSPDYVGYGTHISTQAKLRRALSQIEKCGFSNGNYSRIY